MKSFIALCLSLLVLFSNDSFCNEYSPENYYYAVEYLKPAPGAGDLSTINLVINKKIDAQTADRLLREELTRAIALFPPHGNIMAFAWATDVKSDAEQAIKLRDGSSFIIFSAASGQILTEVEYNIASIKSPAPGKRLEVQVSVDLEKGRDGRAHVIGRTNLPDKMMLMLTVRGVGFKYGAQSKLTVLDGGFSSEWFSDKGGVLPTGKYQISISSPLPSLQPESVQAIIGKTGENLDGPIQTWMGNKMIEVTVEKRI